MIAAPRLSVVVVTGLSGAGKGSILHALEDAGYEAVDNPPLPMLEEMVARGDRKLAVGVDARTRGFDADAVLEALARLRLNAALRVHLVYAWAAEGTLLRRYTESRRRHPLAPQGPVTEGIAAEVALTESLRAEADLLIDTTDLPIPQLRRMIEQQFGTGADGQEARLVVSLMSFAYPRGLPREADLVFDARFLRNPHYDPILRPQTGREPAVAAHIEADPDFAKFFTCLTQLVDLVLPRFVQEGKKYATIAVGCTGGKHRSVHLVEKLASHLTAREKVGLAVEGHELPRHELPWRVYVTHRELARAGSAETWFVDRPVARRGDSDLDIGAQAYPVQAQEA